LANCFRWSAEVCAPLASETGVFYPSQNKTGRCSKGLHSIQYQENWLQTNFTAFHAHTAFPLESILRSYKGTLIKKNTASIWYAAGFYTGYGFQKELWFSMQMQALITIIL
jgi:hypothetical protein